MKRRITAAAITFFLVGIIFVIMIYPKQKTAEYIYNNSDIVETYSRNEASDYQAGVKLITKNENTKYIVIKYLQEYESIRGVELYLNYGEEYDVQNKSNGTLLPGTQYAFFSVQDCEYESLYIISEQEWSSVEMHSGLPEIIESRVVPEKFVVFLAIVLTIMLSIAAFYIQGKIDGIGIIFTLMLRIWNKRKIIIGVFLRTCGALVISGIIAVCMHVSYLYVAAVILLVVLFIGVRKIMKNRPEIAVLGVMLIVGTSMILGTNAAHEGLDVDSHYRWALNDSYAGRACITQADQDVFSAHEETFLSDSKENNRMKRELLENDYGYVIAYDREGISIPHLPAGIFMAVVRFFGGSFTWIYKAGEFGGLLTYALLCYFGMKKLKSGKIIMAMIAMFPTSMLIATNYSYDYWVIGFGLLGSGYFIGNCQSSEQYISMKDTIIMVCALAMSCIPKSIYIGISILPFLMPKSKIEKRKRYYGLCMTGIVVLLAILLITTLVISGSAGDLRGGETVSPSNQIQYITHNVSTYATTLLRFLAGYLSVANMNGYIGDMGYLGASAFGVDLVIVMLLIATFTDKCDGDNYKTSILVRSYVILLFIGTMALVATALYISFTPVGALSIEGCQPRYIIPLLFPLLVSIGSGRIKNNINRTIYNYGFITVMSVILCYDIYNFALVKVI